MSTYQKEWILGILFAIIVILHVDFWAWDAVYPILLGFIPYSLWWGIIVTVLVGLIFVWWNRWGWPEPPEEYDTALKAKEDMFK
ncbi:MAG: hypothetical protein ACUVXD_19010 [Thermodesulfobacteriota bacterium]